MDPLQFAIHSDVITEALATIVVIAMILERSLAPLFEWSTFMEFHKKYRGLKEPIAIVISISVTTFYGFDSVAIILSQDQNSLLGYIITGGVIAGGSKGSIKLFRDWMGWKSNARKLYEMEKEPSSG